MRKYDEYIEDYYYECEEAEVLEELGIDDVDDINEKNIENISRNLCGQSFTGTPAIDLVLAAKVANSMAHKEKIEIFYIVKARLLEAALKLWGNNPYESYGVKKDELNRYVIYFDIPETGKQYSFHLVETSWDPRVVPEYKGEWKGYR